MHVKNNKKAPPYQKKPNKIHASLPFAQVSQGELAHKPALQIIGVQVVVRRWGR